MDSITSILASGLRARAESLDIAANNIANSGTPAFKSEFERYALYGSQEAIASNGGPEFTGLSPDLRQSWINFGQGNLERTERTLDVGLEGNAYFATEMPGGKASDNLLTRNGSFQIGTDGQLKTKEGFKVKLTLPDGTALAPGFRLDPAQSLDIDRLGVIHQNGAALARLDLVQPPDNAQLTKSGDSYFAFSDSAALRRATGAEVHQGWLEKSNADPIQGGIQLVKISRQFEMLQKALQLHGEMSKRSIDEVGRV
ncbi:flagellar hook-basal body protein [Bryobacter aggregatus]|uniref:flagellar hook-basal body protein n=1 Tax=Bryobacter aggregatus TaxID=360054 RepID=UPI0004E1E0DF|nr:flagellar hook basal-body protein [Bryobacter aggregatus]